MKPAIAAILAVVLAACGDSPTAPVPSGVTILHAERLADGDTRVELRNYGGDASYRLRFLGSPPGQSVCPPVVLTETPALAIAANAEGVSTWNTSPAGTVKAVVALTKPAGDSIWTETSRFNLSCP